MNLLDMLPWLFFYGIAAAVAFIFIRVFIEMFRVERHLRRPTRTGRAAAGGVGFTDAHAVPGGLTHEAYEPGDSSVEIADSGSDSGGGDSGGGDFSGGGGDYGGGGSGGSWS